ncbi:MULTISPECIES: phosphatidate cytidylyltransferase [Thalassobaculum]|uniref:Phosphatidate cytidylyltransferase n=1 Tax=Thalassobaculum litoreum DSM 18839 TaxID=1123362 RepID=A0A8G2BLE2_9PROT|nr:MULTISPECIES: phosphatidate cytidylyltransferase [Thalassobaculum]SDG39063.1 phosphatidate cytidylyltransferase [Thalassobaculum litoreum DSM 18839]
MTAGKDDGREAAPVSAARSGDLRKRVVSSLVLVPAAGLLIWAGGSAFDIGILFIAGVMAWEWGALISAPSDRHRTRLVLAIALLVSFVVALLFHVPAGVACALVAVPISVLLARQLRVVGPIWLGVAVIGTVFPALALVWMRSHIDFGLETVIYVIASVAATDIGAYVAGRTIGGPKLMPKVSPSKTWAGLAGGMAGSMLVAAVFTLLHADARGAALVPLAIGIALIAQAGDLLESAVKRHFKVKDSGSLIPGHGGILDRVDGMMTVLPVVALAMWVSGRSVLQW